MLIIRLLDSGNVTPIKRKPGPDFESPFLSAKKPKSPGTTPKSSTTLVAPSSQTSSSGRVDDDDSPKRPEQEHSSDGEVSKEYAPGRVKRSDNTHHEPISSQSVFDNDDNVVSTSGFITGDDLLAMVDGNPAPAVLVLWKGTASLAARDRTPIERVDPWLIPHKDGNIQNVAAFKAAYGDVLDAERVRKSVNPNNKGGASDVNDKDLAVVIPEKSTKRLFEVSISRNTHKCALATKLIKGAIEGNRIVPTKEAKEEGTFWLNEPTLASQSNMESLDHVVELSL